MLEIEQSEESPNTLKLRGRFDASQVARAHEVFGAIEKSCVIDFGDLDYISSAGLGVLLATQKRLGDQGEHLKLINMKKLVRDVFRYSRLDTIFEIE